jgi:hypothetical protein
VGIRAIARSYCHEPSTALGHFGTKFGLLGHSANPDRSAPAQGSPSTAAPTLVHVGFTAAVQAA